MVLCFCKYLSNKRGAKETVHPVHPLGHAGEDTVTEAEGKAEVPNAFFASVLNSETSCASSARTPEPADGDGEQNEAPIDRRALPSTPKLKYSLPCQTWLKWISNPRQKQEGHGASDMKDKPKKIPSFLMTNPEQVSFRTILALILVLK